MALSKLVSDFDIDDLLYILIAYIIGMLASALSGKAIFHIVGIEGGTNLYIVSSPLLAAVLEPILSKLAPAILIVYWMSKRREELLQPTQAHPFLIGAYGGACVGIVEAFGKLVTQSGMYAGVSTISTGIILAAIGHVLYGGIIGNAVYRRQKTRWWHNTATATLLTILLHFSWNGYRVIELLNSVQ